MSQGFLDWYKQPQIQTILAEIDGLQLTPQASAKLAWERIPPVLHLPRLPDDITSKDYESEKYDLAPRSVFEELAILKCLYPDEDIRGLVVFACYNVSQRNYADVNAAALRFFGNTGSTPDSYYVYFFGEDVDARIDFDIKSIDWVAAGARSMWINQ